MITQYTGLQIIADSFLKTDQSMVMLKKGDQILDVIVNSARINIKSMSLAIYKIICSRTNMLWGQSDKTKEGSERDKVAKAFEMYHHAGKQMHVVPLVYEVENGWDEGL